MPNLSIEKTIISWIEYAKKIKRFDLVKTFWLLWDYTDGGLSKRYYYDHAYEALDGLKIIDRAKGNNDQVCSEIEKIINKYKRPVAQELR
jgi:hypothetical protein